MELVCPIAIQAKPSSLACKKFKVKDSLVLEELSRVSRGEEVSLPLYHIIASFEEVIL